MIYFIDAYIYFAVRPSGSAGWTWPDFCARVEWQISKSWWGSGQFWIPPLWQNQEHQEKHLFDSWTGNMNKSQVIIQVSKGLPSNLWVWGFFSILMNVWLGRIQRQFTEWNFLLATSYWHFHVLFICQLDTQKYCLGFEGEVCCFRSTVFTEECSMISENHLSKGF